MATEPTKIAVTGAAGYIGSRVLYELQATHPDWHITAIDNFYLGTVRQVNNVEIQHVDIRDRDMLEAVLSGADIVIHLAAISGVDDCGDNPDLAYEVNVEGTNNVAWFCRQTNTGLIFPFSMASIGDPTAFPITTDHPRDPLNWYGRTKLINERSIETFADGAFPAYLFMISNLYGEHVVGDQRVSKGTVINFFAERALSDQTLTVYKPGRQARNYVHVKDVARAYVRGTECLLDLLEDGETGTSKYEIASDECPSVMKIAKLVASLASDIADVDPDVELVDNPRGNETLVDRFEVDTTSAYETLGWETTHDLEGAIEELLRHKR